MLQVCLNGARDRGEHPRLPLTPGELAEAASAAVAEGARSVHLHPRDRHGRESLLARDCAAALWAVRAACPGVPVGVSTGLWIVNGDIAARANAVASWTEPPDFASVNFAEPGAVELCEQLRVQGVGFEVGLATVDDAQLFLNSELTPLRVLVEVEGDAATAVASAQTIEAALGSAPAPLLEHGYGCATWDVVERAARLGHQIRVGLEDTLVLPDGTMAADNAELVAVATALLQRVEAELRRPRSSA